MSRSGDRIFGNPVTGNEVTRHEVGLSSWRGHGDSCGMKLFEQSEVRTYAADVVLRLVDHEVIVFDLQNRDALRLSAQAFDQLWRWGRARPRRKRRKVHR